MLFWKLIIPDRVFQQRKVKTAFTLKYMQLDINRLFSKTTTPPSCFLSFNNYFLWFKFSKKPCYEYFHVCNCVAAVSDNRLFSAEQFLLSVQLQFFVVDVFVIFVWSEYALCCCQPNTQFLVRPRDSSGGLLVGYAFRLFDP